MRKTEDKGFTLMEVIFAVAIIGISLVTLLGLQIKTIRLQQVSNRTEEATLLAQEMMTLKMIKITSNPSMPQYFEEGDFEEEESEEKAFESYHWEYTLSTTEADSLFRIDLTVSWNPDDKENNSITLSSFVTMKAAEL